MSAFALKLIVGLGNPGAEYARTRHNIGFWLADELARRHGAVFKAESRYQAELARLRIGSDEIWLLKPQSFMNRSGGPVQSIAAFYKIPLAEVLVAHDDIDLGVGTVRLKEGGGHGGNNGLRDIIATLGDGFWRLRFGVGHPGDRDAVVGHVLARAPAEEERLLLEQVKLAADAVPVLLAEGPQKTMNRLHGKPPV